MKEFFKDLAPYGELIFVICQFLVAAVMIYLGTKFASKKDMGEAKDLAVSAHHRLDLMEKDIEALPDFATVNKLTDAVSGLQGDVRELTAKITSIDEKADIRAGAISRIEEHLLSNPRN